MIELLKFQEQNSANIFKVSCRKQSYKTNLKFTTSLTLVMAQKHMFSIVPFYLVILVYKGIKNFD